MKAEDVIVIKPQDFAALEAFGQAIVNECQKRAVDFIGQYGWLCLTPKNVIKAFQGKMVNQHPGPLDPGHPDFGGKGMYGRRVHAARLMFVRKVNRDFWTEATAQRVAVNFDQGAVLKRKRVPILENDDVDALQARVLPLEHEVQIETLQDFSNGTVKELNRDKPLVLPGEESILEECKREAIRLYPER
jgi:phosphoribosylglycinamide formyltransferase-1